MTTLHTRATMFSIDTRALEGMRDTELTALMQAIGRAVLYGIHDRGNQESSYVDTIHTDVAQIRVAKDSDLLCVYHRSSEALNADAVLMTMADAMDKAGAAGSTPFIIGGVRAADGKSYSWHS